MKHGFGPGVELFIREDGAYTTVAAAVSVLVVLTLVFSSVNALWTLGRSADIQVAADAAALSGGNAVASYHTIATVADACALSMGLAGFALCGAGLVGLLIPSISAAASASLDAGVRLLDYRNSFVSSASRGLSRLERALPFLVAAAGTRTARAQGSGDLAVTGTALAVPRSSASRFPALEQAGIATDALSSTARGLEDAARDLDAAAQRTRDAKREAWLADCGREGRNMQERAARLSGIAAEDNPDFASSLTWDPSVAVRRTRAYYAWRALHEEPTEPGREGEVDSAARRAFYLYAMDAFAGAHITETDEGVAYEFPLLPGNTAEMRESGLYTDALWPTTVEDGVATIHCSPSCPRAQGARGPNASLRQLEMGEVSACTGPDGCAFGAEDLGRMPAASTSIDNGYEYHLRAFTHALAEYARARDDEIRTERRARDDAASASQSFADALSRLGAARPRIAPPGRHGVVALVGAGSLEAPRSLDTGFAPAAGVAERGAVAAAALAPDEQTSENNVLSTFFQSLADRDGGSPAGLVDDVMSLWGSVLSSYGDVSAVLGDASEQLVGDLDSLGAGPVARWLGSALDGIIRSVGLEPVDLRLRKPALTDSADVIGRSDAPGLADVQEALRSIPLGSTDPSAIARAVSYEVGERVGSAPITIAELTLPDGGTVPLTVDVRGITGPSGASSGARPRSAASPAEAGDGP